MKLYVYDNDLLGDDGTDFENALVDEVWGYDNAECIARAKEMYSTNDYTFSFIGL